MSNYIFIFPKERSLKCYGCPIPPIDSPWIQACITNMSTGLHTLEECPPRSTKESVTFCTDTRFIFPSRPSKFQSID